MTNMFRDITSKFSRWRCANNLENNHLQNESKGMMKGNMTALEPRSVSEKGVKRPQPSVLPPVNKGQQKTQPGLSLYQHTVLPPICKAQRKMSLETVLRDSKLYLTQYELEEIKDYKQVWYLGERAQKTRYSKVTETQDVKSFNSGYDTEEGFYKAIRNDHLAYRFEILEIIGTGYSGQVLKCMDHMTMNLVAIKVIRSKDSVHHLGKAEVKILEALRSLDKHDTANIVHMREHFYFRNHLCITFELFEKDLYKALKETNQRGFSDKEVRKYTIEVLKCLQMLKKKRIIHGDLKPDNILISKKEADQRIAVSDFGGSYFAKDRDRPPIHTLCYASPEMLLGKRCSPATDMWSLGCMLAELYLGHHLFRGRDNVDHFNCIMKVLGVPPAELLVEAPKRNNFFDSEGNPLKIKDIMCCSTTLTKCMNSRNPYFLDFIQRCLKYDPTKRITPKEALQHPWIQKQEKTEPVMGAKRTSSGLCSRDM